MIIPNNACEGPCKIFGRLTPMPEKNISKIPLIQKAMLEERYLRNRERYSPNPFAH
jgi:hypothetical protein